MMRTIECPNCYGIGEFIDKFFCCYLTCHECDGEGNIEWDDLEDM